MSFGTPIRLGPERVLNATLGGAQSDPVVTALADGRFVAVWVDGSLSAGDTSGTAIRMRIFNADGTEAVAERLVNTITARGQENPSVTALADGDFLVSWTDYSNTAPDTSDASVRVLAFDASGNRRTAVEAVANVQTANSQYESEVVTLADGRMVVLWTDANPVSGVAGSSYNVRGRFLSANGAPTGNEFAVHTAVEGLQYAPDVAALPDGGFVAVWNDSTGDFSGYSVWSQVFSASGAKVGGRLLVNTTWSNDQLAPSVTSLAGGGYVVVWQDYSATAPDTSSYAVRGRVFGADNVPLAADFLVNSTVANAQLDADVTALSDGRFVVTWTDASATAGDLSGSAIRGQVFAADGMKHGNEFLINGITFGAQIESSVTELADGRILVAWTDLSGFGGDPAPGAIKSQIFDPRIAPAVLAGSVLADQFMGTGWGDDLAGWDGQDTLWGLAGDDRLNGEAGNDRLLGGQGRDRMWGGSGNDAMFAEGGNDRAAGGEGNDRLDGGAGDDHVNGDAGADSLMGGVGRDRLAGGAGLDQLRGGAGADQFVFDTAREAAALADRIADFDPLADLIAIDNARFTGIGANGALSAALFKNLDTGTADLSDRILYDTTGTGPSRVGTLFFDPDGAGSAARVAFAVLALGPTLTAADILVI